MPGAGVGVSTVGGVVAAVRRAAVVGDGVQVVTAGSYIIGGVIAHVQPFDREVHRDVQFAPKPFRGRESLQI